MDLYRAAYKVWPLVPSELVVDCFALAREIRAGVSTQFGVTLDPEPVLLGCSL